MKTSVRIQTISSVSSCLRHFKEEPTCTCIYVLCSAYVHVCAFTSGDIHVSWYSPRNNCNHHPINIEAYLISSEWLQHFGLMEARDRVSVAQSSRLVQQSQSRHVAVLTKLNLIQRKQTIHWYQFAQCRVTCMSTSIYIDTQFIYMYIYEHMDYKCQCVRK